MIVVDRLQLRSQIDAKMRNMNIENSMFLEAHDKKTFQQALTSDKRLVIINLQKFQDVRSILDADTLQHLAGLRIVFLIDEIHRSNSGSQHEEMVNIFDELQTPFDANRQYNLIRTKKNLIIGFTATPDDNTLARFGEYSGYAESEKLWVPFDSYTMNEAIRDKFILNPSDDVKDPIEVYFDNQIGIVEVETQETEPKKKRETKVATSTGTYKVHQFDILAVIEARNEQEELKAERIQEFEGKIQDLFQYVRESDEGQRLIVKINSDVPEDEIYDDFAKIYRKYKILNRKTVGEYFFKEMEDLINKLCDDFEATVRNIHE
jgi:type I site-specific restriction-modification system R (restriction) subunit